MIKKWKGVNKVVEEEIKPDLKKIRRFGNPEIEIFGNPEIENNIFTNIFS